MVFRLDPPLPTSPTRLTEATDARMAIRRDESKVTRHKEDEHAHSHLSAMTWEDIAVVSTASLRAFLQSLLAEGSPAPGAAAPGPAASVEPPAPHPEPTSMAARAVSAYQSMGRAVHDRNVEQPPPPQPAHVHPDTAVLGHDVTEEDRKRLAGFVGDLIELERRGITELEIQRSLSFLESVETAIRMAQAKL